MAKTAIDERLETALRAGGHRLTSQRLRPPPVLSRLRPPPAEPAARPPPRPLRARPPRERRGDRARLRPAAARPVAADGLRDARPVRGPRPGAPRRRRRPGRAVRPAHRAARALLLPSLR